MSAAGEDGDRGAGPVPVARMIEDVVGCKWTLSVLDCVRRGIGRPGEIERSITGLRTKVLNERLRKLLRFGVLSRTVYAEVPPRVEYRLTDFGLRFVDVLDRIAALQAGREDGPSLR
ncbi:helix-turn-helix domain-containing protein [Fontimonas sp. SYSU GA230001]|uniref:winged helix-turn-helix transcriptional regulator n=1 Tax=Fontimonas sp. SYSU GA230001 TaxID=3142450 RepID=UPI0032B3EB5B